MLNYTSNICHYTGSSDFCVIIVFTKEKSQLSSRGGVYSGF